MKREESVFCLKTLRILGKDNTMSNLRSKLPVFFVILMALSGLLGTANASNVSVPTFVSPLNTKIFLPIVFRPGAFRGTIVDEVKANAPVAGVTVNLIAVRNRPATVGGSVCDRAGYTETVKVFRADGSWVKDVTPSSGSTWSTTLPPGSYQAFAVVLHF
jgi:hypothetical protein